MERSSRPGKCVLRPKLGNSRVSLLRVKYHQRAGVDWALSCARSQSHATELCGELWGFRPSSKNATFTATPMMLLGNMSLTPGRRIRLLADAIYQISHSCVQPSSGTSAWYEMCFGW